MTDFESLVRSTFKFLINRYDFKVESVDKNLVLYNTKKKDAYVKIENKHEKNEISMEYKPINPREQPAYIESYDSDWDFVDLNISYSDSYKSLMEAIDNMAKKLQKNSWRTLAGFTFVNRVVGMYNEARVDKLSFVGKDINKLSYRVHFANSFAKVTVIYDWRDGYIHVQLQPLNDQSDEMGIVELSQVVAYRAPDERLCETYDRHTPLENAINDQVNALEKYATDILSGDFEIISVILNKYDEFLGNMDHEDLFPEPRSNDHLNDSFNDVDDD